MHLVDDRAGNVERSAAAHVPPRSTIPLCGLLVGLAASLAGGCADLSYDRVRLGMTQRECERLLPADAVWRTELGFCHRTTDAVGRTDALVVLLGRDQCVAGKLQATCHPQQRFGLERGFWLRGELDPLAMGLGATGPVDALRAVAADLADYQGVKPALEAHALVAAGLVRLVERWPHMGPAGANYPRLADTLEVVPGGGEGVIRIDGRGTYIIQYRQPNVP